MRISSYVAKFHYNGAYDIIVRILPQTAWDCSAPDCVTYPAMDLTGSEEISAHYYTTICKISLCEFRHMLQNFVIMVPMTNFVRILPQTTRDYSTSDCVTYPALIWPAQREFLRTTIQQFVKICHANLVLCWKTLVLQNWTTHTHGANLNS